LTKPHSHVIIKTQRTKERTTWNLTLKHTKTSNLWSCRCLNCPQRRTKEERQGTMKKMIINVITIICVIILGWFAWSFIDIVSDNKMPNPNHANTNAFVVLVNE
jgi:hypothetical protein